jgi:hypothetical protein
MNCKNKFISRWFEFNLDLNNILSAYNCRKYQLDVEVIEGNEAAEVIKSSAQRDFGLFGIIDDLEIFQRLAEEEDMFEREKNIDLLRWKWLEENAVFEYFSFERMFVYLAQLEIIERWMNLDAEQGEKVFRNLINELKSSVVEKVK